ncbi:MAG: ubiquinol-cytochrome C chaperone family protein [Micropepsaceae bacterium]
MLSLFSFMSRGRETARQGAWIYNSIVEQARRPEFYQALDVADTIDGRFDLIVLHAGLYMPRLKMVRTDGKRLSQAMFDHMFANLEFNLRELGLGDMGVPRHMKGMVQAFYGRVAAYEAALKDGDATALRSALHRNVYRNAEVDAARVDSLASYVRAASESLQAADDTVIAAGAFEWPAP